MDDFWGTVGVIAGIIGLIWLGASAIAWMCETRTWMILFSLCLMVAAYIGLFLASESMFWNISNVVFFLSSWIGIILFNIYGCIDKEITNFTAIIACLGYVLVNIWQIFVSNKNKLSLSKLSLVPTAAAAAALLSSLIAPFGIPVMVSGCFTAVTVAGMLALPLLSEKRFKNRHKSYLVYASFFWCIAIAYTFISKHFLPIIYLALIFSIPFTAAFVLNQNMKRNII